MTPMNRVRVSIRRRSQHDGAVMLGKYFLFTPSNVFQMAENRLISNRHGRLRGQIKRNDIKKTIFDRRFLRIRQNSTQTRPNGFHPQRLFIQMALMRSALHSLFMHLCIFLFTLPTEMWRMPGCHVCRIPHFLISLSLLL